MFVKQISVFLENIKGSLSEMTGILAAGNVDLMALSIADTQNFGILRCVVRSQDCLRAIGLLREQGYTVRETNVLCVGVPDQPGGLNAVLKAIEDQDLSIEYTYSFVRGKDGMALIIFRLDDPQKGLLAFEQAHIRLLSQSEVDAL